MTHGVVPIAEAPGVTTRWHRVKGTSERYVILEGKGRVEVGTLAASREPEMLQLRPNCECCNRGLPPDSSAALICSFECTFCRA